MMSTTVLPPRRKSVVRRFLRSYFGRIFVALALIGIICSFIWWPIIAERLKEERIAQKVATAGGSAGFGGPMLPLPLSYFWIFRAHRRCVQVDLSGCKVSNGLLDELKEFRHLELLNLANTTVTDADLEHLRKLDQLQVLGLQKTQVTGSGLEKLKGMTNLRSLDLSDTILSDAGLEHLKGVNIRQLDLTRTAVTEAGLEHLKDVANLTNLHFEDMPIGDVGMEQLKRMTNLRRLSFNVTPRNKAAGDGDTPHCNLGAQ